MEYILSVLGRWCGVSEFVCVLLRCVLRFEIESVVEFLVWIIGRLRKCENEICCDFIFELYFFLESSFKVFFVEVFCSVESFF